MCGGKSARTRSAVAGSNDNSVGMANDSSGCAELMCQPLRIAAVMTPRTSSPLRCWTEPLSLTSGCRGMTGASICAAAPTANVATTKERKLERTGLLHPSGDLLLELWQDHVHIGDQRRVGEGLLEFLELVERAGIVPLLQVDVAGQDPRALVRLAFVLHCGKVAQRLQRRIPLAAHHLRKGQFVVRVIANFDRHAGLVNQLSQPVLALQQRIA